jgi:hypothetical protein
MTRVKTSMRPQPGREIESFLQLNQVRAARFEHGAVATEIDLVEDVVLQLPLHRIAARQKAAADAQGPLPQAQVEAGGLHVRIGDVEAPGVYVAGTDGPFEELAGEHSFGRRLEVQHHDPEALSHRLASTLRAKHVASWRERSKVGTASGTACG